MLLNTYKESGLLFYTNFLESTPDGTALAYRGDLVLIPGEVGDDMGHTKPPKDVLREAAVLADDKIHMLIGGLDKIASLPALLEKYQDDFSADMKSILFIVNLTNPIQVEVSGGVSLVLIPLVQGVPWNEAIEELALEKSDFKGQKPAEKLQTVLSELKGYKHKYPSATLEEALTFTNNAVREIHGAV